MDLRLKGAKVLVTAASSGLGAAIARQFSLEGAFVVINSRKLDKLQDTAASIVNETTNPVFTMAADVTDIQAAQRMVKNAAETLGGLDIMVTNAGGLPVGIENDTDQESWRKAIDLNLMSTLNLIQAALPYLRRSSRAAILMVTSIAAKQPVDNFTLSNTVHPAMSGLTRSLSHELWPEGIRVNSILPDTIETKGIHSVLGDHSPANKTAIQVEQGKSAQGALLQRSAQPEEVANAAVFLCSPAASFITGVALPIVEGAVKATI